MAEELISGFDAAAFCGFVNEKFSGSFSRREKSLPLKKAFPWKEARQLGIVKTLSGPNGSNMPLLVVAASLRDGDVLTERSSRIRQFKFAKQVLDDAMSNPAPGVDGLLAQGLFVFHDELGNFRLSLVYGKAEGSKLVWSTAKRLSFYVEAGEPNKTFRDRAALDWSSFDKLKEAFSVEKLTREFYTRLFAWYQRTMDSEDVFFPNDIVDDKEPGEVKSEQIIRLITRLMFVWFLKQKHLVPNDLFDLEKLSEVLKQFDPAKGENYYRAILQNLFFATLNTEISDRAFAVEGSRAENEEHFGVKIFYRYASEFAVSEDEVIKLFSSIPFMNGGLFECLDRDNHYYDGFSRRKSKRAQVPNALFFDEKGLIPLLRQYNFTVEENSPGDEEVALDPEMLGKVFENLLAAYNPETNSQARKATGSFYTPREIVNYMVDESLIAHLITKCGEENSNVIRKLFTDGERPEDSTLCKALDESLVTARILDPACGSGAFPMGILLRMVELLRILRDIPEDENVYDLKLELIENCIYGSDIQCIAVQISKLRFFISLVCEEGSTGIPACGSTQTQAGMPVLPSVNISRRNLPHWKKDGAIYWITFRLADSIPQHKLNAWKEEFGMWLNHNPTPWDEHQWKEYDKRFGDPFEKWLDAGTGSCALGRPDVRKALISCLLKFNEQRLFLHSAVIMPSHWHCLMELPQNEDLSGILKGIKGASARAANKILGAAGKFWMDESYDHIVRSQEQYKHFIRYIEENPVKAGLSGDRYWLYQSSTGVSQGNTGIPACDSAQTGMSVLRSGETQAGMPVLPCAENNYGIHTLPNLETKFVAADSLIGLPKSGDALPMANVEQLKKELWDVRHKHFRARSYREKKELRKEDRKLRTELAKELRLGGGFDTASAKLMAEWDPYDQNASAPFSDPEWMFNVKDGFDVVIGNPPYIDSETMKKICPGLRDYLRVHLQATKGNWDMYIAFYEVGYSLLNNTGILSYISPNKWLSAPYGLALRSMLERHLCRLCDCSKVDVFEAGNTPLVAFLNKRLTDSTVVEGFLSGYILTRIGVVPSDVLNTKNWGVLLSPHVQMLARLKHQFSKLSDRFDVENPFATSEAYELRPLVQDASYKAAQFFKLINTGTISKFQSLWGLKQTAYLKGKYVQPVISKPAFGEIMPKRAAQSGRVKIITKGIRYFYCMLDSEGCYVAGKSTIIVMDRENNIDSLLQLLPVLNSKLVFFYIKESYSALGIDGGINFSSDMVEELPLPTPEQDSVLSRISKKIIKLKQEDPSVDTSALEAEIDQLVYDLYGLTEEEKAIVESASKKAKGKKSAKPSAKKKAVRGKKTQLPDSLPGWD